MCRACVPSWDARHNLVKRLHEVKPRVPNQLAAMCSLGTWGVPIENNLGPRGQTPGLTPGLTPGQTPGQAPRSVATVWAPPPFGDEAFLQLQPAFVRRG